MTNLLWNVRGAASPRTQELKRFQRGVAILPWAGPPAGARPQVQEGEVLKAPQLRGVANLPWAGRVQKFVFTELFSASTTG